MLTFTFHVLIVKIAIIVMLTFTCFFSRCVSRSFYLPSCRAWFTFRHLHFRLRMFAVRCSLFAVRRSPFAVCSWLFTVHRWPVPVRCSLSLALLLSCLVFYFYHSPFLSHFPTFPLFYFLLKFLSFSLCLVDWDTLVSISLSFLSFLLSFSFSLLFDLTLFDWLPRHGGAGGLRVSS